MTKQELDEIKNTLNKKLSGIIDAVTDLEAAIDELGKKNEFIQQDEFNKLNPYIALYGCNFLGHIYMALSIIDNFINTTLVHGEVTTSNLVSHMKTGTPLTEKFKENAQTFYNMCLNKGFITERCYINSSYDVIKLAIEYFSDVPVPIILKVKDAEDTNTATANIVFIRHSFDYNANFNHKWFEKGIIGGEVFDSFLKGGQQHGTLRYYYIEYF